jgi:hypothetical protein
MTGIAAAIRYRPESRGDHFSANECELLLRQGGPQFCPAGLFKFCALAGKRELVSHRCHARRRLECAIEVCLTRKSQACSNL